MLNKTKFMNEKYDEQEISSIRRKKNLKIVIISPPYYLTEEAN